MTEDRTKRMKELPAIHLLGTGTPMCAGCGGLKVLHEIYDILGTKTVFTNAAGCMTLLSVYPFTPFRGSWLYTAMASAPAGAQGIRDALDILTVSQNSLETLKQRGQTPSFQDFSRAVVGAFADP